MNCSADECGREDPPIFIGIDIDLEECLKYWDAGAYSPIMIEYKGDPPPIILHPGKHYIPIWSAWD